MGRVKKRRSGADWTEKEFEQWFANSAHPERAVLPDGKRIVILRTSPPVSRLIDILALDENADLVIIECKNEPTGRVAIGQALEYLAQYKDVELEGVLRRENVEADRVRKEFRSCFKKPLTALGNGRRVFILAPSFQLEAVATKDYLSERFKKAQEGINPERVSFAFLIATRNEDGGDFTLRWDERKVEWLRGMTKGRIGVRSSGSVRVLLAGGPAPVSWRVGRLAGNGHFEEIFPGSFRTSDVSVQPRQIPCLELPAMNRSATWEKVDDPRVRARLLGILKKCRISPCDRKEDLYVLASLKGDRVTIKKVAASKVAGKWRPGSQELPGWDGIARRHGRKQGKSGKPAD